MDGAAASGAWGCSLGCMEPRLQDGVGDAVGHGVDAHGDDLAQVACIPHKARREPRPQRAAQLERRRLSPAQRGGVEGGGEQRAAHQRAQAEGRERRDLILEIRQRLGLGLGLGLGSGSGSGLGPNLVLEVGQRHEDGALTLTLT